MKWNIIDKHLLTDVDCEDVDDKILIVMFMRMTLMMTMFMIGVHYIITSINSCIILQAVNTTEPTALWSLHVLCVRWLRLFPLCIGHVFIEKWIKPAAKCWRIWFNSTILTNDISMERKINAWNESGHDLEKN